MSATDVPLWIKSANTSSERRISPAWSIAQLKARLEPITGVPLSSQHLVLRVGSREVGAIEPPAGRDEQSTQLASFPLQAYAEIFVSLTLCHCLPSISHQRVPRLYQDLQTERFAR